MVFTTTNQPTNQQYKHRTPSPSQLAQIETLLSHKQSLYLISKHTHLSTTKLANMGIKSQLNPSKLKRLKKDSTLNPSEVYAYCDLSDITSKSLCDANKTKRILWFKDGYMLKLAVLATSDKVIIQLFKTKSRGELKQYWQSILKEAISLNLKTVAIDTNCKFTDTPIKLVHLVKDSKHPYNQIVESKIGHLKKLIYNNISNIKLMTSEEAIAEIKYLASLLEHKPLVESKEYNAATKQLTVLCQKSTLYKTKT